MCVAPLAQLVITYPAVLSRSVESNLEPKLKWLEVRDFSFVSRSLGTVPRDASRCLWIASVEAYLPTT